LFVPGLRKKGTLGIYCVSENKFVSIYKNAHTFVLQAHNVESEFAPDFCGDYVAGSLVL